MKPMIQKDCVLIPKENINMLIISVNTTPVRDICS